MAFHSRSSQQDEFGSGGKISHSRRYLSRFSPYNRPSPSAAPLALMAPEPEAVGSPSWFRSLVYGAGKLISSVLGSDGSGSSSECSSDYSSDEENDNLPNEYGDHLLSDDLAGFNKLRENVMEDKVESLAIIPKSESKLVIEQLLLQETFTRDECSKLLEILRSRVLDIPAAKGGEVIQEEVPEKVSVKSPWQSLKQNWNIYESSNTSPSNPSAFSPRYCASKAVTPDLRNRAVMEAKKWFEEKKLSPSSIRDQKFEPCVLNTDMNQYCFDSDSGSPIEMAKFYMQSLPPWRSPSSSTSRFNNSPSSGKHKSCSIGRLPSEVKLRDYFSTGTSQSSGDFLRSIADEPGWSKLKQTSTTRPPLFEVSRTLPATTIFGNKVQDEPLRFQNREAVNVGHPLDMHKEISHDRNMEQEMPKIASESFIEELHSDINSILSRDSDMFISDKNQDVGMPSIIKTQIDSNSASHDSLLMISMAGNDGDSFPKTGTFQAESVFPAKLCTPRSKGDAIQVNPDSDFIHANSFADSQQPGGNLHILSAINRTAEGTDTDGHLKENNSDVVASCVSEQSHQQPGDISSEIPNTQINNRSASKPLNGTKMKSLERVHPEPLQSGRGKRRAKKVVRQERMKGCRN